MRRAWEDAFDEAMHAIHYYKLPRLEVLAKQLHIVGHLDEVEPTQTYPQGASLLGYAFYRKHQEAIALLLLAGADPNVTGIPRQPPARKVMHPAASRCSKTIRWFTCTGHVR